MFSPYASHAILPPTRQQSLQQFIDNTIQSQAFDHRAYWQLREQYGFTAGRFSVDGVDARYAEQLPHEQLPQEGTALFVIESDYVSGVDYTLSQDLTFSQLRLKHSQSTEVLFDSGHIALERVGDEIIIQLLLPPSYMQDVLRFFNVIDHPGLVRERNWFSIAVFR